MLRIDHRNVLLVDEHGDIADGVLQHPADRSSREPRAEQRPAPVDQHEVDALLGGEPCEISARIG
jgi:hypothetical protein